MKFFVFVINVLLYQFTRNGQIDAIVTIVALLGGSLGIVLSLLIFDRKAEKGNLMSRVVIFCILVIQIIIFLVLNGVHGDEITVAFWEFFEKYRFLLFYIGVINIVTFIAFAVDKYAAINRRSRIRNVTLLGLCFIGGSLGGFGAMYLFHHKTNIEKNDFYVVGVPMIIVMQVVVILYLMNL